MPRWRMSSSLVAATTDWSPRPTWHGPGRRVLVLERRSTVGGAVATEELFPGFHISSCSFTTHVLQDRVVADLELHRHGYRVHRLDPELFVPFPDGHADRAVA